jgi:hypothetical protein
VVWGAHLRYKNTSLLHYILAFQYPDDTTAIGALCHSTFVTKAGFPLANYFARSDYLQKSLSFRWKKDKRKKPIRAKAGFH